MPVFTCPWLRKVRPLSPADVARSYQCGHPEGAYSEQGPAHAGSENVPSRGPKQPESFTHRLRRRFSRESKSSHDPREPGKTGFHFSLKPSRSVSRPGTEPAMLEDIGSSLMSERGYDSDAHVIPTPDRVAGSTATRGIRRMALTGLIERSQEREESERWATCQDRSIPEPPESAFGMRFISTPNNSLRGPRGPFHALHDMNGPRASLGHESARRYLDQWMSPARSLPNLNSTSQKPGPTFPDRFQVNDASGGTDDPSIPSDWAQFMRKSHQKYGMVPSGSQPNLSTGIVVPKRREATSSGISYGDPRSVHLGDMGISHRLASQTMSSEVMSNDLSITELVRRNLHDGFMPLSSESFQRHGSGTSAFSAHEPQIPTSRQRDASSYYSRQASGPHSANISPGAQSPRAPPPQMNAEKPIDNVPDTLQRMTGKATTTGNGSTQANWPSRSKFREHCDIGNSDTSQSQSPPSDTTELSSPRKVSIGWMSGGRRVGYGYSLVPEAQGDSQSQCADDELSSLRTDAQMDASDKAQSQRGRKSHREMEQMTLQEPNPVPIVGHSGHRGNDPATLPRIRSSTRPVKGHPVPPYLQAILGRRSDRSSQDDETGAFWVDEGISGDFSFPELAPVLPKESFEAHSSSSPSEASAKRWAELSKSLSEQLQAQKNEEGLDGQTGWNRKSSHGEIIGAPADNTERFDRKALNESGDRTRQSHRLNSLMAKWPQRFSRHRETRRHSDFHQQEPSDASSGTYFDCDANSLSRAISTKSVGADDLANKYRERLQMPGSYEGSRWASRSSQMLWDMCTTDDP